MLDYGPRRLDLAGLDVGISCSRWRRGKVGQEGYEDGTVTKESRHVSHFRSIVWFREGRESLDGRHESSDVLICSRGMTTGDGEENLLHGCVNRNGLGFEN